MNNIGCMYRDGNSKIKLTKDSNLGTMRDIENLYICDTDTDQECDQNITDNYDSYDNDAVDEKLTLVDIGGTKSKMRAIF